jgi:Fe-S cluster assembly iron-binding protein IscA
MMLTQEAAETIRRLIETPGADGLRISRPPESQNGSGPDLQIELVAGAEPDDAVVEADGVRIYLDAGAEETMEDKVLHADVSGEQVQFQLLVHGDDQDG